MKTGTMNITLCNKKRLRDQHDWLSTAQMCQINNVFHKIERAYNFKLFEPSNSKQIKILLAVIVMITVTCEGTAFKPVNCQDKNSE